MDDRWLSVDEVAGYLGITRNTVYKWISRLGLPGHKIGRLLKFSKPEIDDWVKKRSTKTMAPKTCQDFLQLLKKSSREIHRYGVKSIGIFGSCVKGEAGGESDVDVLVELIQPSFDSYMELKFFLEALFGRDVDLVLVDSLKEQIKPEVLREVVYAEGL